MRVCGYGIGRDVGDWRGRDLGGRADRSRGVLGEREVLWLMVERNFRKSLATWAISAAVAWRSCVRGMLPSVLVSWEGGKCRSLRPG